MFKYSYKILKNKKIQINNYSLKPIDIDSIEKIRSWRNNQIDVLRQKTLLTIDDQKKYFDNNILNQINKNKPYQIILLFYYKKKLLGYGGITNIDWVVKRGELAFLLNNKYANKTLDSEFYFPIFLKLILILAFKILNLNTIWSETFSIRPKYIRQLELNNFINTGIVNNNIIINNKYYSSFFHEISNPKKLI